MIFFSGLKGSNMKRSLIVLLFTALLSGCAGLGMATVGAVMYYKSQSHEVATVDIKAPANKVYNKAVDIVSNNPEIDIIQQDDTLMLLDINQDDTAATIKISQINRQVSQLTISADARENDGASRVLDGVFRICKELKVECKLSE